MVMDNIEDDLFLCATIIDIEMVQKRQSVSFSNNTKFKKFPHAALLLQLKKQL